MLIEERIYGKMNVKTFDTRDNMGKAAADEMGRVLCNIISQHGQARVIFASAPSQSEFLAHLCKHKDIDWSKVIAFHQDEWVGVPFEKEYSFGNFIKKNLFDVVHPGETHFVNGMVDMETECDRYAALISEKPIDIICLGIGENGHTAFNEPHEADFNDPKIMKTIALDERCRNQQYNDFGFASLDDVPKHGITVTIPTIMKCKYKYVIVPSARKAEAVRNTLYGEISEKCPASILREADNASMFIEEGSASML